MKLVKINNSLIKLNNKCIGYTAPFVPPADAQYLKFTYDGQIMHDKLHTVIEDKGYSAVDEGEYVICYIDNAIDYVSFGHSLKQSDGYYGCADWYLPNVTSTTGLFEWTPLTSIPDNFSGLSASKNLGRAFNCLQTQGAGLREVKSFDGLANVETFEYAFYQNKYTISYPTAFAPETFAKCSSFYGAFQDNTASNNMVPFAEHCNSACTSTNINKNTGIASCPDKAAYNALGWS